MRIALRVGNDLLRRALADLLAAAGHEVERNATPTTRADLFIVSEPALLRAPQVAPTLVLRPAPGTVVAPDPVAALRHALAVGGVVAWAPPLSPADLVAALGAGEGRARDARVPSEAGLDLAPDAWLLVDPTSGAVRWANAAARVGTPATDLEAWVGDRAPDLRRALADRAAGRRRVDGLAGPRNAVWWTEPSGQRVVGLLAGPGEEADLAAGNLRTLAELGRTLSVLAHELRNPIASLAGALDMLGSGTPEDQAEVIELARGRLVGMRALLDDVLRYARPFRGEPTIVDVAAVVESAEAAVRADARLARCVFEHRIGADVVNARAHEEPLRQALVNLLMNAGEAMNGVGRVLTRVDVEGAWAVVRVVDEGPGIAREHLERVFEPFWTTKSAGTGLGLAHVRRVAEAAGGRARVEPQARGACFRVDLHLVV